MPVFISYEELGGGRDECKITEVEHLSSYNWTDSKNPVILVPGFPGAWNPPRQPKKLQKDVGLILIAQNAYRMPERPMEPLFRAVVNQRPDFQIPLSDVITDRNNLRKLLSYVQDKGLEPFTIKLELVGSTLLLSREEAKTFEIIEEHEFKGFGHEFKKVYTKNRFKQSTGHHRIITYKLGHLKIVLRHKTDGYLEDESIDNLLDNLTLASKKKSLRFEDSRLEVELQGEDVPLASTIEIKTRTQAKPILIDDVAPQLWLSQTPNLVRAYHRHGLFDLPKVENVQVQINQWEERNKSSISNLVSLLDKLREIMKDSDVDSLKFDPLTGRLCLYKSDKVMSKMLTDELYDLWTKDYDDDDNDVEQDSADTGSNNTLVIIGGVEFRIDVSDIPYLAARRGSSGTLSHEDIDYFDIAIKGLRLGFRKCFQLIPADIEEHLKLMRTYKLLEIDVLGKATISDLVKQFKHQSGYGEAVTSKAITRDTAYKLLLLMSNMQHTTTDDKASLNSLFHAVLFVISHPRTFKCNTRLVIKAAHDQWFEVSSKQKDQLNKWNHLADPGRFYDVEQTTDEASSFGDYDSDWS